MSTTALKVPIATPLVGMGQIALVRNSDVARAVLGSCVAVMLYHPRRSVGAIAHVVLPRAEGRSDLPGKFADTAIPHMIKILQDEDAQTASLVAKLAGGANMFGKAGPLQIGESNIEAVTSILAKLRIPVKGEHLGGLKGRRLDFDCTTGDVKIDIAGEPSIVL